MGQQKSTVVVVKIGVIVWRIVSLSSYRPAVDPALTRRRTYRATERVYLGLHSPLRLEPPRRASPLVTQKPPSCGHRHWPDRAR
jgi:hypothetical protein